VQVLQAAKYLTGYTARLVFRETLYRSVLHQLIKVTVHVFKDHVELLGFAKGFQHVNDVRMPLQFSGNLYPSSH
jgi:hypothetical protein